MANCADRVFMNAKVYSVSLHGAETRAEVVAVKDGKFVFIGNNADVKAWIGESTEVTDCKGGSLLPGLCDAHMHFAQSIRKLGAVNIMMVPDPQKDTPDTVITEMQKRLKAYADTHPDDKVIHGKGWNRFWFTGDLQGIVRPFTRHDIDAVISDRPVVLDSICGHVCMLNTAAIEAAGLSRDTPEPSAGIMCREADGYPDGYLQEPVIIGPVTHKIPNYVFSAEDIRRGMLEAQDFFASMGHTYISDLIAEAANYDILHDMCEKGEIYMYIDGMHNVNDATREADIAKAIADRTKYDVEGLLKVDTVKYFVDGSYAMIEPYTDEYCDEAGLPHGFREKLLWDEQYLMESMEKAQAAGFNIHAHCMGDWAVKWTAECYANAKKQDKENKLLNTIAHCTYVTEDTKKLMGETGTIASIQPGWFSIGSYSNPTQVKMYGLEKAKTNYPCRSFLDNDVVCAFGSDYPINEPFGIHGIQVAITRRACRHDPDYELYKDIPVESPQERITFKEAILAHTIKGAYQFHRENETGSIELGKSADCSS